METQNSNDYLLGQIGAKLDSIIDSHEKLHDKVDAQAIRLNKVESKALINGLSSGAAVTVMLTLIKHKIGLN